MISVVPERDSGPRGILAGVDGLELWIHLAMAGLAAASVARYVRGHGISWGTGGVLLGVTLLLAVYAFSSRVSFSRRGRPSSAWALFMIGVWSGLVLVAPSFSWLAVPLSFVALRVLAFHVASVVLVAMTAVVVVAWTRLQGFLDPTIVVGPAAIAGLALVAYQALDRESSARRVLVEELRELQTDLAQAQHQAGVSSERARLSRDIHDGIAQAFTSINLLLQAAEQDWMTRPESARSSVTQAAITARDGLNDLRTVVRDLAPAELGTDLTLALPAALESVCAREMNNSGLHADVRVHGDPVPVSPDVSGALLRSTSGLLANVREHSAATTVTVSLTYQPDSISVDVKDDGRGFDPDKLDSSATRGLGLSGIRDRVHQFGGHLDLESSPQHGTTAAISIPIDVPT